MPIDSHRDITRINYQDTPLDIHYQSFGNEDNSVIILLHPSPLSSNFMIPMLPVFEQKHHVIAWDAPGYGDSSKLSETTQSIEPYIDCLALFMESLSIDSAIIYGNATGAQIAIEFSKKYPDKTVKLLLENVAWFHDEERAAMLESYFPDLSPSADGSHLVKTWEIVNNLFKYFPWYDKSESAKLTTTTPPLDVLQAMFVDYVKAGSSYADAYIAAINNERPAQLQAVSVKTDIVLWQDSIIYRFCQRVLNIELPAHIVIHSVNSGIDNRIAQLTDLISEE